MKACPTRLDPRLLKRHSFLAYDNSLYLKGLFLRPMFICFGKKIVIYQITFSANLAKKCQKGRRRFVWTASTLDAVTPCSL